MKRITIKRMSLVNFKGFRDYTIDFDPYLTEIRGCNGSGKTTIFDAFMWLLFGKNSEDRQQFGIKTLDAEGKVIPQIPHEVSAILDVSGEEVRLCRRYNEKWVRRRGTETAEHVGHEEERLYNDVPCSVKEFSDKINALCSEQMFKYITNPLHFTSQKQSDQRAILFQIAGGVEDTQIAADNVSFEALLDTLQGKSIEEYKREIAAKKKRIQSELNGIPERIDEQQRVVSSITEDFAAVEKDLKEKEQQLVDVDAQLLDISNRVNAANDVKVKNAKRIGELEDEMIKLERSLHAEASSGYFAALKAKNELSSKLLTVNMNIKAETSNIEATGKEIDRCKLLRTDLIAEWKRINAQTLTFNEGDFICPTCKRPLDVADIELKQERMSSNFNAQKAQQLEANVKKGKANNAYMEELSGKIEFHKNNIAKYEEEASQLKAQIVATVTPQEPDMAAIYASNEQWADLDSRIKELSDQLRYSPQSADDATLKAQKKVLWEDIKSLRAVLAQKSILAHANKRIAELTKMQREQTQALTELEWVEFTIAEFSKAKAAAIEDKINSLFHAVRFKLFDTQMNGEEVETCEALIDGVPFSDANAAGRFNAGLDIINTLCKYNDVSAPIFADNAESVNEITHTDSQMICLYVSEDASLQVMHKTKSIY